jgi:uncharacterized membrane protein
VSENNNQELLNRVDEFEISIRKDMTHIMKHSMSVMSSMLVGYIVFVLAISISLTFFVNEMISLKTRVEALETANDVSK